MRRSLTTAACLWLVAGCARTQQATYGYQAYLEEHGLHEAITEDLQRRIAEEELSTRLKEDGRGHIVTLQREDAPTDPR